MNSLKQYEVLKRASLFLAEHGREERAAQILLEHHLDLSRTAFYMNMQEEIPEAVRKRFEADIKCHAETGMPIQHMIGYEVFYGRKFSVDKHVLIPRQETEELVEKVIEIVKSLEVAPIRIIDVGTGSGVIAITLALELQAAEVAALDISAEALKVAKRNASDLRADIKFMKSDYLETLIDVGEEADIIVSNPPYIAESERADLSDTVKSFDPELALFADENGLAAYKAIIRQSKKILKPAGILAFEIGHTQGPAIKALIKKTYPQATVDIIQDINKKNRIILAYNNET